MERCVTLHAIYPWKLARWICYWIELNRVVHFDGASGFDGYIESVEMYNYYKSIPSGLIADRMTYLCEKYKIPKRADGSTNMNRSRSEELFHIELASRTDIGRKMSDSITRWAWLVRKHLTPVSTNNQEGSIESWKDSYQALSEKNLHPRTPTPPPPPSSPPPPPPHYLLSEIWFISLRTINCAGGGGERGQ